MPIISRSFNLETPNNSGTPVLNTHIDLAMELSEYYGRNIRQGNNFVLKGVSASLRPLDDGLTDDYDTGMAAVAVHSFCPANKHSRKAWNLTFQQWKKQKLLAGKVGPYMRNDDFEIGYSSTAAYHNATRTSSIYAGGIGDSTKEQVMIYGASTDGDDFTLEDFFNSQLDHHQVLTPVDPFTNTAIKANKFSSTSFPAPQLFNVSATSSAVVTDVGGSTMYSGAVSQGDMSMFPIPLNILCGLMKINVYVNAPDTTSQMEDNAVLTLTYYISKWKPLVYRPKPRRKKPYRATMRKSRGRSRRRRR